MKKLIIQSKLSKNILKTFGKKDTTTLDILNKAIGHKYIRRWPAKNRKGWDYLYPKDLLNPLKALLNLFSFKEEKIDDEYTKNNIQKDYGADKKTFATHILEYFSNKIKWDTFFSKKENQDKYKSPQKSPEKITKKTGESSGTGAGAAGKGETIGGSSKKGIDKKKGIGDTKGIEINKSLMRKIRSMYGGKEVKDGKDTSGSQQEKSSAGTPSIRAGGGEAAGDQHGVDAGTGNDRGEPLQRTSNAGERSGRDVRLTKRQATNIRQACLDLLNSKSDSEMTEEDKNLLRQYEGAGGLGEDNASAHGTLYEFYTPRNVTQKVWQIVDKYIPSMESVLEPLGGLPRIAQTTNSHLTNTTKYHPVLAGYSILTKKSNKALFKRCSNQANPIPARNMMLL